MAYLGGFDPSTSLRTSEVRCRDYTTQQGGGRGDSNLQSIESILLGSIPNKRSVFTIEVDERVRKEGVVGNPNANGTTET